MATLVRCSVQVAQLAGLQPEITKGTREAGKLLERKLQACLCKQLLIPDDYASSGLPENT